MSFARFVTFAALAALAACAGLQPAGRSAMSHSAPPPPQQTQAAPAAEPAPPPAATSAAAPTPPPGAVTVPGVAVTPPPPRTTDENEIVVPGVQAQQVQPPHGDPRTQSERMADIRAWDHCVTRMQDQGARDPMRPDLEAPEDYCRRALHMADRLAVPDNRQP